MGKNLFYLICIVMCIITLLPAAEAACREPYSGIQHWWTADDTVADKAGSAGCTLFNGAGYAPGFVNKGFSFDGVNDYASCPHPGYLSGGSIEAWVSFDSVPATIHRDGWMWLTIAAKPMDGFGDGMDFGVHPAFSPNLTFGIFEWNPPYNPESGEWHWADSGMRPQEKKWYHFVGTWGPGGMKFYIDGVLRGQNSYTGGIPSWTNYLYLGANTWGGYTKSTVDELKIYNRALSAAEVRTLYDSCTTTAPATTPATSIPTTRPTTMPKTPVLTPTQYPAGASVTFDATELGIFLAFILALVIIFVQYQKRNDRTGQTIPPGQTPVAGSTYPAPAAERAVPSPAVPAAKTPAHHDVFISYSHDDKAVADAICAALESQGIRCWIAPRDVLPGEDYPAAIICAIEQCRIMVLVYSSRSNTSEHVTRELSKAVSNDVIIIPFRIEDIPLSKNMEYLIGLPHWLDAMTPPMERHIGTLVQTVKVLLAGGGTR